jgi:hypothetical protein
MTRHTVRALVLLSVIILTAAPLALAELPQVRQVAVQPLGNHVAQLLETMEYLGIPLPAGEKEKLTSALKADDPAAAVRTVQEVLDRLCVLGVHINPESRVKVEPGPAKAELVEQGWRQFLVKVHNEAGVTAELRAESPNARSLHNSPKGDVADRWLDMQMFNARPLNRTLSGLELEYRIVQLYSRDAGKRAAKISFNVGQGTQDIGFRNEVNVLFDARPSTKLVIRVRDETGPVTAGFVFRDKQGHVYPSQAKRLAPDFAFHPQIYRADGEHITLPPGRYTVEYTRGPEYFPGRAEIDVRGEKEETATFNLRRWIDPSTSGWWSGDHHIHAAGCAHYTNPTEGVHAPDMMRHCLGEDLKVGCNLTWGPCFDYQKQFFTGAIDKVSQYPYLLRYDVEVSGFGSHQSGHLCLLRLKEQMYPGGDSMHHWPTLGLNTLKWAKKQGAVTGPAHSGWGLDPSQRGEGRPQGRARGVATTELPNYIVPPYDGIGANEYVVDVTHDVPGPDGKLVPAVDFISTADTPYVWELNMWYHTLNCGFRTRASGETDFPCIYQERVGLGRSYVKLDDKLDFDTWCEGIRQGRSYVGDGRSHLIEFTVDNLEVGTKGSEIRLPGTGTMKVTAKAAALLPERPDPSLRDRPYTQAPYWHLERARRGDARNVKVECVVNGYPVASRDITADGQINDVTFDVKIDRSSWVALRILPSSHTNPVFVLVDDKPIRASRRSAEWCLKGVDQCWSQKERFYRQNEREDARAAYAHARETYRRILAESVED